MSSSHLTVAFWTPKMIVGGAESYILAKTRWLVLHGVRVIVFSEGGENVANLPKECVHYQCSFDAPFTLQADECRRRVEKLVALLRQEEVQLIEAHNTYPIYYAYRCSRITHIPVIYNLLNELSHTFRFHNPVNRVMGQLSRSGCYATLTPAMNCFVERLLWRKLSPKILPIPVEPVPDFRTDDEDYILSVCRFTADKMYVLALIEGFAEACQKQVIDETVTLKIVGDGVLRPQVEDAVRLANDKCGRTRVVWLGTRTGDDLFSLYAHCRLYVGMGTTILQAAQYGKPIALAAFAENEKQFAWGFWGDEPADRYKIAAHCDDGSIARRTTFAQLLACVANPELLRRKGEQALELVHEVYDLQRIMEQWQDYYAWAVERGPCCSRFGEWKMNVHQAVCRGLYALYQRSKR